jgi:acetyl esterase
MSPELLTVRDRVGAGVARFVGGLPPRVQRALAGRPVRIDGQELDPGVQLVLRLLELSREPSFETLSVPEARTQILREAIAFRGTPLAVDRVEELELPGPAGPIAARLYAQGSGDSGLLVYLHGGGWVLGDLATHDPLCRFLAREAGVAVLAVDYRRAPEHPFPAAVEDSLAAFRFASEHAAELVGTGPDAVAVGGDSAGGNLTATVSQLATAEGGPRPAFQLMLYPVTDLSRKRRSYELFADGFFLTERQMDWYRDHYLPGPDAALDPRASPLLAGDLAGLPPAYVATAGFDVLRDEGEEYARRLREAGVATSLRRHRDLIHAFANAFALGPVTRAAVLEAASALRVGLSGAVASRSRAGH